ncbi:alpha/beta hydrolase [Cochlodiniinecator piscidefendens]|uniref:alpha/beta hydrolase n=1 Tax=Cochlodiniinecator piscidefendens TaxID=2715756 RepID=UPI00140A120D|nr:alpha/beta fold hydrolase [Cochlodiniinecator piscidefendens]
MTNELTNHRRAAASGTTKSVVVFLHGYGADGADLLGLADPLSPHMPDTVFLAPDAPQPCSGAPMGRQWFPIPWIDGSSEEESMNGLENAMDDLNAYLDKVIEDEGVSADNIVIFGFSQGTMTALHVIPRRADSFAGIVAFSGRLLEPEYLAKEAVSKPPVLLVHGDQDDVVPPQSLNEAAEALGAAEFDVYSHIMRGTGHGIAPDGLSVALTFMRQQLRIS